MAEVLMLNADTFMQPAINPVKEQGRIKNDQQSNNYAIHQVALNGNGNLASILHSITLELQQQDES
jgi:predicted secreted protein